MPARKRANGEGTIYRRSDGRYEGAAVVPVRGGGRRRVRVYATSRDEAREKLDRMLDDARQGIPRAVQKQTVEDYLDYWLEHVVKPELRPTTHSGYEIMVRRHITPVLGRKYVVDLTPADIRRLLATLREKETSGHGAPTRSCGTRCPMPSGRSWSAATSRRWSRPGTRSTTSVAAWTPRRRGRCWRGSPTTACTRSTCARSCSGCAAGSCSG